MTEEKEDRHDRTRLFFGERRFMDLAESRVLVVGAGAVGSEVICRLARVGVGELVLVDPDRVEASNLNRGSFFDRHALETAEYKVDCVARGVAQIAPESEVEIHAAPIEEAPERVWSVDGIVLAVDDNRARQYVNTRLLGEENLNIPVINAAIGRTFCEVQFLIPGKTACLLCLWGERYHDSLMKERVREACNPFFERARESFPALGVVGSMAADLAATEAIKWLSGSSSREREGKWPEGFEPAIGESIRFDLGTYVCRRGPILRNPRCVEIFCRSSRD
jgi:molybdopterin/thiamine biosynthesis adenylyltransferase